MTVGRIRLMLADDEGQVIEAMTQLVSTDPLIDLVGTAKDAGEAIDLAELHLPDVALLDVRMPGGGGSRAAREDPPALPRDPDRRIVGEHRPENGRVDGPRGRRGICREGSIGDEVLRAIHRSADGRSSIVGRSPRRGGGAS